MLIKRLERGYAPTIDIFEPDGVYCYFRGICHVTGKRFDVSESYERLFNIPYKLIDDDNEFKYFLKLVHESACELSGCFSITEFRFCDDGKTKRFKDYTNNQWVENFG